MRGTRSSNIKGTPVIRTERAPLVCTPLPTVAISDGIGDDSGVYDGRYGAADLKVLSAMVTFGEFLAMQGGGTAIVAVIVSAIRVLNARRSTKHWFIGWVVFVACVGGYATAGTASYILDPMNPFFFVNGIPGLLLGLIVGNVIGAWVWRYYHKEIEGKDDDA